MRPIATMLFAAIGATALAIASVSTISARSHAPAPEAAHRTEQKSAPRKAVVAPKKKLDRKVAIPRATPHVGALPDDLIARRLAIPVPGVDAGDLRPDFFDLRGRRGHEAIDIAASWGQPVVAVEDGTIAQLFASERGGLTVYQFDPEKKYVYYYAHLAHYADGLAKGDNVKRGQIVGYVGSTGNAVQPHLHFAIFLLGPDKRWWKGDALDPYPALTQALDP